MVSRARLGPAGRGSSAPDVGDRSDGAEEASGELVGEAAVGVVLGMQPVELVERRSVHACQVVVVERLAPFAEVGPAVDLAHVLLDRGEVVGDRPRLVARDRDPDVRLVAGVGADQALVPFAGVNRTSDSVFR